MDKIKITIEYQDEEGLAHSRWDTLGETEIAVDPVIDGNKAILAARIIQLAAEKVAEQQAATGKDAGLKLAQELVNRLETMQSARETKDVSEPEPGDDDNKGFPDRVGEERDPVEAK